jgi:hypothetical protein
MDNTGLDALYEVDRRSSADWPRLWQPSVYVQVTEGATQTGSPLLDLSTRTLKVIVGVSSDQASTAVSPGWDMAFTTHANTTPVRLPIDYRGWFVAPRAETLFKAIDIRARGHHISMIEAEGTEPIVPKYTLSVIICAYKAGDSVIEAVKSLANQSLDRSYFEIVIVNNDPDDTELANRIDQIKKYALC